MQPEVFRQPGDLHDVVMQELAQRLVPGQGVDVAERFHLEAPVDVAFEPAPFEIPVVQDIDGKLPPGFPELFPQFIGFIETGKFEKSLSISVNKSAWTGGEAGVINLELFDGVFSVVSWFWSAEFLVDLRRIGGKSRCGKNH